MTINPISSTDNNINASTSVSSTSGTSEFSSYLNKDATLDEYFTKASETYGVPKALLEAITMQESSFNPNATSRCGAQGLMQLMPATAASLGVTNAYDPEQNIMGGSKYISQLIQEYNGDIPLALAAYNAGSNNVKKYGGVPPFKETQDYVVKVMGYYTNGVEVPNTVFHSSGAPANIEPAIESPTNPGSSIADKALSDVFDKFFSYEDYLRFLTMYTKQIEERNEQTEKEKEKDSPAITAFQQIRYSRSFMNLMDSSHI